MLPNSFFLTREFIRTFYSVICPVNTACDATRASFVRRRMSSIYSSFMPPSSQEMYMPNVSYFKKRTKSARSSRVSVSTAAAEET